MNTRRSNLNSSSRSIHNRNCWSYLFYLKKALKDIEHYDLLPHEIKDLLADISDEYKADNTIDYPKQYQQFINFINNNLEGIYKSLEEESEKNIDKIKAIDQLCLLVYFNPNQALHTTYDNIKGLVDNHSPTERELEKSIQKQTQDLPGTEGISPQKQNNIFHRLSSVLAKSFSPMETTSIPVIRNTPWLPNVTQIRLGTQAMRDYNGTAKVNFAFNAMLKAQVNPRDTKKITHIYFNLLKRDESKFDIARNRESQLTKVIEDFENEHDNLAVVTLPGDQGIMDQHDYLKHSQILYAGDTYNEFLNIVLEDDGTQKHDFSISPKLKNLFSKKDIRQLLNNSFITITGVDQKELWSSPKTISYAERQAIWVHFTKYEIPNYLIQKVHPKSINFSCKDGIDRGGVASVYFNLIKSFASSRPITMDEFNREIQAPPTMVKGRGMNFHINLLWNVINSYVNNNRDKLNRDSDKRWLLEWRDLFCPSACKEELFKFRLQEMQKEFKNNNKVMSILEQIEKFNSKCKKTPNELLEMLIHLQNISSPSTLSLEQTTRFEKFIEANKTNNTGIKKLIDLIINLFNDIISKVKFGQTKTNIEKLKIDVFKNITSQPNLTTFFDKTPSFAEFNQDENITKKTPKL